MMCPSPSSLVGSARHLKWNARLLGKEKPRREGSIRGFLDDHHRTFNAVFGRCQLQGPHAGPVRSSEQIRLDGGVGEIIIHDPGAAEIGGGGIDQDARRSHKVSVTGDIRLLVHPRHDLAQEGLQLGLRVGVFVVECKLCDPDRTTLGDRPGLVDKVLEVGGAGVLVRVPVDVDEVDGAAGAVAHEPFEVGETGGGTGVGDGGCSQLCPTGEGLHVLLVRAD